MSPNMNETTSSTVTTSNDSTNIPDKELPLAASIDSEYVYNNSEVPTTINSNANDIAIMQINQEHQSSSSSSSSSLSNYGKNEDQQICDLARCISDHQLDVSDGEESGEIDREYNGQFEGPEKTLEVLFRPSLQSFEPALTTTASNGKTGLRTLSRSDLDRVCKRARCTILSSISNQYLDAYVLSESSLFVYNYMIVIKTCGTTTLLRCLAVLIDLARTKLNLELDWVGYSRKNFNFPDDQQFPHGSFTQELNYLYSHKNLSDKLGGNGYTLGPITDDHWFVFIADKAIRSQMDLDNDRVLNIMMFDIDVDIGNIFYYQNYEKKENETEEEQVKRISVEQTKAAGIDSLCPGAIIDPRAFEPCGYSMNAILYKSYCTMHITPEEGSSYASFETNQKLASYTSLINNVIRTFKPKKFVMTLMADEGGLKEINKNGNPLMEQTTKESKIIVPNVGKNDAKKNIIYKRTNLASITVEDDCVCMMGNWTVEQDPCQKSNRRSRGLTFA